MAALGQVVQSLPLPSGTSKGEFINRIIWVELSVPEESPWGNAALLLFPPSSKEPSKLTSEAFLHNQPAG